MFNSAKNTRIFAIFTLASTFVYYKYKTPELSAYEFGENEVTFDLNKISNYRAESDSGGEVSSDESGETTTERRNMIERMTPDVIKNMDVDATEEDISAVMNRHKGNHDERNIIVVNNLVYHVNDTIPEKPFKYPLLKPSEGKILREFDYNGRNYRNKDRRFLKEHAQVMIKRTKKVAKVCNARSKMITSKELHLVWDTKHSPSILYCPIYKVASTSWMINFLRLAHFNEDHPALKDMKPRKKERNRFRNKYGASQDKVYELYPPPRGRDEFVHTYRHSLRVIVVRHPFTRLLSAYRDKMTKMEPKPLEYRFRDLQLHIITKYRPVDSEETSPFPTFPEFIQYILDSTKNFVTLEDWKQNVVCWTPYWAQCNVCGADYNVILKLETIEEDERFLITLSNLEELKEIKTPEWRHLNNKTSDDVAPKYYSQLSRLQIRQLYQRYLLDFMLFDYHIRDIDINSDEEE
ncbi:hypothetical protein SK128_002457 [Halocaridina rubra]|uniref:Carbohydrate sulfotransferase n=1 Tax=Halocaridina rubra TaxID=373956 RepID=A0AAN8XQW6_HALRR